MSDPYDPHTAALDALAAMRWPDVSEPPKEQVEAMEALLRAMHQLGAVGLQQMKEVSEIAWVLGSAGRPLAPPK